VPFPLLFSFGGAVRNFLFFLLGFFVVFVPVFVAFALEPVDGNNYSCTTAQSALCTEGKVAHFTIGNTNPQGGYGTEAASNAALAVLVDGYNFNATAYQFYTRPSQRGAPWGGNWGWYQIQYNVTYIVGVPTPPPCAPPNALNAHGVCVPCPTGEFFVGDDTCIPLCDYSHPYRPGDLYNPGSGTCVQPPCGSGQVLNDDGRCVPNCPEGKKLDVVTGACVADCPYGTTWNGTTCANDCPAGQMKDGETGACIKAYDCLPGEEIVNGVCAYKCLEGETRKPDGSCTTVAPNCPFGQHEEGGKCVATSVSCPSGSTFDTVTLKCKSAPVLLTENTTKTTAPDGTITETKTHSTTIVINAERKKREAAAMGSKIERSIVNS